MQKEKEMSEKCPKCGREAKYLYNYQPEGIKATAQIFSCEKCGCRFEKWIDREKRSQKIQLQLPLKNCKIG